MKLELELGRPKDARIEKETRCYDILEELGIPFYRVDHEAAMTIDSCQDVDACLNTTICKNLFLCNTQKTCFYLLVMPGRKKFQTKLVSKQLGVARLSFAPETYLEQYLDITPGSVSIMGLMNDHDNQVQLLVDRDLLTEEFYACHPCLNTTSLKMSAKDMFEVFLPAVKHDPIYLDLGEEYL